MKVQIYLENLYKEKYVWVMGLSKSMHTEKK